MDVYKFIHSHNSCFGKTLTLYELADLIYERIQIDNPKYKPPIPSCSHFSSVEEMKGKKFCSECGKPTQIITTPEKICAWRIDPLFEKNNFEKYGLSFDALTSSMIVAIKKQGQILYIEEHPIFVLGVTLRHFAPRKFCDNCYIYQDLDGVPYDQTIHLALSADQMTINGKVNEEFIEEIYQNRQHFKDTKYIKEVIETWKGIQLLKQIGFSKGEIISTSYYGDDHHYCSF